MPSSSSTEAPFGADPVPEDNRPQPSRARNLSNNVQSIFVGRGRHASNAAGDGSNSERANDARNRTNSGVPKTPRFTINMPNLPSTRLVIPHLRATSGVNRGSRSNTNLQISSEAPSTPPSALSSPAVIPSRPTSPESSRQPEQTQIPEPSVTRENWRDRIGRRRRNLEDDVQPEAVGVGPEEQELADLAARGRRRRERRKRRPVRPGRSRSTSGRPVRSGRSRSASGSISQYRLRQKRQAVKSKVVSSIVSGLVLTLLFCLYLALALHNKTASQEFHVIIILIILITTVYFCHSLIRLCTILLRPASEFDADPRSPSAQSTRMNEYLARGPGGYANPENPIRVQILRDEEAVGIESEATKFPPPAYGLWRESVRVDPNRIYWARNNEEDVPAVPTVRNQRSREDGISEAEEGNALERTTTANRPPSYVSEDGVDYIIEARGRSIAPPETGVTEMLPQHADEVSRDVDRRARGISLSQARRISRR